MDAVGSRGGATLFRLHCVLIRSGVGGGGGGGLRVLLEGLTIKSSLVRMQTVGTGRAPPQNLIEMLARRAFNFHLRYFFFFFFFLHLAKALQRPLPPRTTDGPLEQVLDARWRPCWLQWCISFTAIPSGTVRSSADRKAFFCVCFCR